MVSKQWYHETIKIFVRSREFGFFSYQVMLSVLDKLSDPLASCITSVVLHVSQTAKPGAHRGSDCEWPETFSLTLPNLQKKLPKLTSLRLHFSSLPEIPGPSSQKYKTAAFLEWHGMYGLCNLRGLKRFDVVIEEHKEIIAAVDRGPTDYSIIKWLRQGTCSLWLLEGDSIVEDIRSQVTLPKGI